MTIRRAAMAVVLPQLLLAGLFLPRERMPDALRAISDVLRAISDVLPVTYAYEALGKIAADEVDGRFWLDVAVIGGTTLCLALGAATLRRRTS